MTGSFALEPTRGLLPPLGALLLILGCQEASTGPEQIDSALDDGVLWPETAIEAPASPDEENPWLEGFGGANAANQARSTTVSGASPKGDGEAADAATRPGEEPGTGGAANGPIVPLERRFDRYLEGSGSDKLLTIVGEEGVSPVSCSIEIYSNGGTDPWRTLALPDALPAPGSVTLCSRADLDPACQETMSGSVYNGNDALVLRCGEEAVDRFGRLGENPGTAWSDETTGVRSEGQELVRCRVETQGPGDPFDIAAEWITVMESEGPSEARERCDSVGAGWGGAGGSGPSL